MFEETKYCAELSKKLLLEMLSDGYSSKSIDHHISYIYNSLTKFCTERFEGEYSIQAGKDYMTLIQMKNLSKDQTALNKNSVERLNHALNGDFHWRPGNQQLKPYATSCYDSIIADYERYLIRTGKTNTNVRNHIHSLSRFFVYIESIGIMDIFKIKVDHVYERFIAANNKQGFHKTMKMFFSYAYKYGLTENDISRWIPTVPGHKPVPSVYTLSEIGTILGSINRNTLIGKRNYCIILLAAKLGIRSCDITVFMAE